MKKTLFERLYIVLRFLKQQVKKKDTGKKTGASKATVSCETSTCYRMQNKHRMLTSTLNSYNSILRSHYHRNKCNKNCIKEDKLYDKSFKILSGSLY